MKSPRLRTLIILTAAMVGAIWIGISLTAGPPWQRSIVDTAGSKGAVESPLWTRVSHSARISTPARRKCTSLMT
jgi:hypothetical protein